MFSIAHATNATEGYSYVFEKWDPHLLKDT